MDAHVRDARRGKKNAALRRPGLAMLGNIRGVSLSPISPSTQIWHTVSPLSLFSWGAHHFVVDAQSTEEVQFRPQHQISTTRFLCFLFMRHASTRNEERRGGGGIDRESRCRVAPRMPKRKRGIFYYWPPNVVRICIWKLSGAISTTYPTMKFLR